jgi:DNA-binding response OmpR family regulator
VDDAVLSRPVRILQVDEDEDSYHLTRLQLAESPAEPFVLEWVASYDAALLAMSHNLYDVYLIDYTLGRRSGLELLREALSQGCAGPIIMLTGQGQYAIDREAMAAGAMDYLSKDALTPQLLERSIRYGLERRRVDTAVRQAERIEARMEGVTLAARTMAHRLSNAMAAPTAAIDLIRQQGAAPAHLRALVDDAAASLTEAKHCIQQLQQIVRVETEDTVVGAALDLERSV